MLAMLFLFCCVFVIGIRMYSLNQVTMWFPGSLLLANETRLFSLSSLYRNGIALRH